MSNITMNYLKALRLLSRTFFIFCLTFSGVFAYTGDDPSEDGIVKENTPIFHVYDDIDLISTQKVSYATPRIVVKAIYPRLESDVGRENIERFNNIILEMMQEEIDKFQKNTKETQKNLHVAPKSGKNELFIDYDSSVIQSGQYHLISIRMSVEGSITGMAHPFHYHRVLNYNLDTGDSIGLSDLFSEEVDYLQVLSDYAKKTLKRRLEIKDMIASGTAPDPSNYRIWNIKPSGLLITFDEYKVAPYVYGAQTVLVPYSILKPVLSTHSPLTKCMRKGRCPRNNLLTGGFIEEAVNTIHRSFNPTFSQR